MLDAHQLRAGLSGPAAPRSVEADQSAPRSTWQADVETQVSVRDLEGALALADKRLGAAADLADQLQAIGVVVRDRGGDQQYRRVPGRGAPGARTTPHPGQWGT